MIGNWFGSTDRMQCCHQIVGQIMTNGPNCTLTGAANKQARRWWIIWFIHAQHPPTLIQPE
jgi:hypothetical protein